MKTMEYNNRSSLLNCGSLITLSSAVRNLGVKFYENMNLDNQVKAIKISACLQLWNTRKLTPFLITEATKTVMSSQYLEQNTL